MAEPINPPSRSTKPLIVIGAGEHAKVLLDVLRLLGRTVLLVTDHDRQRHGQKVAGVEVAGDDSIIDSHAPDEVELVNAVGSVQRPVARRMVYQKFRDRRYRFASVIHPQAVIAESAQLGEAVQVMAGAVIAPDAKIGENVLINTRASVDHDCVIGDHTHVAPGVVLSGGVVVGDTSHLGTRATVIQGVRIGREALVAAGAVVVRPIADGLTVMGLPARPAGQPAPPQGSSHTPPRARGNFPVGACNVLLSASGRRVALLRNLEQTLDDLDLPGGLLATDITPLSSAYHAAPTHRIVPDYRSPQCLESSLAICRDFNIRLIIPTIDPDLPFYAEHRQAFESSGVCIHLSSSDTVTLGNDKRATHAWLTAQGFPTVRQCEAQSLLVDSGGWTYPIFVKPWGGSSSIGAGVVDHPEALREAIRGGRYIAQTIAPGQEYTVDVYIDRDGRCRCAVPRLRLETRAGEVSKGITAREPAVIDLARRVAEALPGARGVLNIQIFYDKPTGTLNVIEINPRFGGGYPLTHAAGAPMTRWVIEEALGLPCTARDDQWRDGLVMLRYDEAVFISREQAGLTQP